MITRIDSSGNLVKLIHTQNWTLVLFNSASQPGRSPWAQIWKAQNILANLLRNLAFKKSLSQTYWKRYQEYGATPKGSFWLTKSRQNQRFELILKAMPKLTQPHDITLADIGCGYGALAQYLAADQHFDHIAYSGYDISPNLIQECLTTALSCREPTIWPPPANWQCGRIMSSNACKNVGKKPFILWFSTFRSHPRLRLLMTVSTMRRPEIF